MTKGQQQIRCSSGVSIAGRIDSRPQVYTTFYTCPVPSVFVISRPLFMDF